MASHRNVFHFTDAARLGLPADFSETLPPGSASFCAAVGDLVSFENCRDRAFVVARKQFILDVDGGVVVGYLMDPALAWFLH